MSSGHWTLLLYCVCKHLAVLITFANDHCPISILTMVFILMLVGWGAQYLPPFIKKFSAGEALFSEKFDLSLFNLEWFFTGASH